MVIPKYLSYYIWSSSVPLDIFNTIKTLTTNIILLYSCYLCHKAILNVFVLSLLSFFTGHTCFSRDLTHDQPRDLSHYMCRGAVPSFCLRAVHIIIIYTLAMACASVLSAHLL